jgi:hypothetical protein
MKFLLVLSLLAFAGCASPEVRERERRIEAMVRAKYDLTAMLAFLKKTIAEHPSVEGITLSSRVSNNWRLERVDPPARMRSGDWVLYDQRQDGDRFELYYATGSSIISIEAKRLASDSFELVRLTRDEVLQLISQKRANQPPEPTSPSVTDRAGARSAPAGAVAHL